MIYIDIDNTIAASDEYLKSLNSRALENTHLLFKTLYKYQDKVFLNSPPMVNIEDILNLKEPYTLLTALPNRKSIDSFCKDSQETDKTLRTFHDNKVAWVKKYFGDTCKLIIVDKKASKADFCKLPTDILIDDSLSSGKEWQKAGGVFYSSFANYLSNLPEKLLGKTNVQLEVAEDNNLKEGKVDLW